LLEAKKIKKSFGKNLVLKNVSFTAKAGQVTGIIGPNGAGKTTLLKIASTILSPSEGSITYKGNTFMRNKKIRKDIGFVSHEPLLYMDLTPLENLHLFVSLYGLNLTSQQIGDHLARVNMLTFANKPVRSFSRGMVQRLVFAKAVIHNPQFVLLDEPFTAMDANSTQTIKDFIFELKERKKTVLLVMHDLNLCYRLSNRILILSEGEITDDLNTQEMSFKELSELYYKRIAAS